MRDADVASLAAHYARGLEVDRLATRSGRVEFERTTEIITRTLPEPPAVVADIGGGPGRYTSWLLELGYEVRHRDLLPEHVEHVRAAHPNIDTAVIDAVSLDLADHSVDAVLLLGPLYHLREKADRLAALRETRRVVRPGGVVYVAAISRWAPRLDGVMTKRLHAIPGMLDLVTESEQTGWLPAAEDGMFSCYTHTPDELRAETAEAGLTVDALVAVEGITFTYDNLDERMDDPQEREVILESLRGLESTPELLGIGPHLLAVARP